MTAMSRRSIAVAVSLVFAIHAHASYKPQPCGNDGHIQCAVYDSNEVYQITTTKGQATLIMLEPGEKILDNGVAAGFGDAWKIQPNEKGILIKEHQPNPNTNFIVVTNKRNYTFSLVDTKTSASVTWVLSFNYPDTRDVREASEQEAADDRAAELKAERRDAEGDDAMESGDDVARTTRSKNDNYMMQGNADIAPTALWDDGRFTYFQYATGRDFPSGIYVKGVDGREMVPQQHVDRDTIVIHQIAKNYVVRSGEAVLGIRNDSYNPNTPHYNASGTSVPGMVRVYKKVKTDAK